MSGMRRIGAAAMVLALLVGVGACGGDDGDDEDAADETTTTEESDDETTTTEESDDSDDDSGSDSGTGGVDLGNLEECTNFATAFGSLPLLFLGGTFGADTPDFDPQEILDDMDDLAADAPDEVEEAVQLVADTYQEVFENLQDNGFDVNDLADFTDPDFAESIEPLNDADFNEANEVVSEYLTELCGG